MKLIKKLFLKSWLVLKLKVFFTTRKKKLRANRLIVDQPGLALTDHGPNGSGQKSSNFYGPNPINFSVKRVDPTNYSFNISR